MTQMTQIFFIMAKAIFDKNSLVTGKKVTRGFSLSPLILCIDHVSHVVFDLRSLWSFKSLIKFTR